MANNTEQEARRLYSCIMHDMHDGIDREDMFVRELKLVIEAEATRRSIEARIDDFQRMKDYYGRGNIKLWDEPDNNLNSAYLDDHLDELKQSLKQQGDKDE